MFRNFRSSIFFFFTIAMVSVFFSCSEYQEVLRSKDLTAKYKLAEAFYKQSKYRQALRLFEQIVPEFRGKKHSERLMYYYADTYYALRDYQLSGYQFERFAKSYSKSQKREEALFKSAKSYYKLSPRYSLDQSETDTAIGKLQEFIDLFPESENLNEANAMVKELREKKEFKAFKIAKQYHHREIYKVAVTTFNNYLITYPGSPYREKAMYYKLESQYLLAIGSYDALVKERLEKANSFYERYHQYYPNHEFSKQAQTIKKDIDSRLVLQD